MCLRPFHLLLWLLLSSLLGACAALPPRGEATPSQAFTDTDTDTDTADTALARLAAASRPAPDAPGADAPSGFRLLPTGEFAFGARIGLARQAQRGLDLQLYHLHNDQAGRALLRALRAAADRGVRVRLLVQHFAGAQVFADPPDKARDPATADQPTTAMRGLLQALAGARQEVVIVSPYFLPGTVGMPMLRRAATHGIRSVLCTHSLATTDEPLMHLHYSRYRAEMLRLGVQIHEFSPGLTRRSQRFGAFGQSMPRLHAKVALVDRRQVLVGSVNLDARSAVANTEMGVAIDSPALAAQLSQLMGEAGNRSQYRLRLQPDGQDIAWPHLDEQGGLTVTDEEPGTGPWLRFKLWLQSLVVDERLL